MIRTESNFEVMCAGNSHVTFYYHISFAYEVNKNSTLALEWYNKVPFRDLELKLSAKI